MRFLKKYVLIGLLIAGQKLYPMSFHWNYPSDHLPVGIAASGNSLTSPLSFTSWNILNSLWIKYIEEQNADGIKDYLIQLHKTPYRNTSYTEREWSVNAIIQKMLHAQKDEGNTPLLVLQEVSIQMKSLIQEGLHPCFAILETDRDYNDLGLIIYDKTALQLESYESIHGIYSNDQDNYIQDALFRFEESGFPFRVIQTHVPGGPHSRGLEEFADYLTTTFMPHITHFVAGDMNQDIAATIVLFNRAFGGICPLINAQSYPTYLDKDGLFVSYDQIYCFIAEDEDVTILAEKAEKIDETLVFLTKQQSP